jgi:molybdenum cofactor biosynthesis protein B
MMPGLDLDRALTPLRIAVLTLSDTRSPAEDRSGALLAERVVQAGHQLVHKAVLKDDQPSIEAALRALVADPGVDVVLTTGGTGITARDVTPEAVRAVLDKELPGFGEVFRAISLQTVGLSSIQSRALGGVADRTLIFALPGSTGACKDAWDGVLVHQLDSRYRPCNFAELLPRMGRGGS